MNTTTSDTALRTLCEQARTHTEHGERHHTLAPQVWQALRASPLPLAAVPADYGGHQWEVPRILEAVHQVASADPAAGWAAAIHAPAGAFLARVGPQVARQVCPALPGTVVIAGGSAPMGQALPAGPGKVTLSGTWPLVTGADHMDLAAMAARVHTDTPTVRWFLIDAAQATVHHDWDALGLRGSASCSVTVDTTVETAHSLDLTEPAVVEDALYRFPLYGLLAACIAQVSHATAHRALALFRDIADHTHTRHARGALADQAHPQQIYAHAHAALDAAHTLVQAAVSHAWGQARTATVDGQVRARVRAACCHMAATARQVCQELFDAAGSSAVHRSTGLERCWRDSLVASRHALVASRGRQLAGAALLGRPAAPEL
ncbi:hypothetical protein [Nocardiopsis synnemataformans]|uniref:hypothetical protein n=1 Tax=Nocardiopsis synnemataformans TaxID=61305 RepID=UPI003EB83CFA